MIVSVVIPTFNRRHRVQEALDSVHKQRHRPIEVIIIDDGSTDGTEEAVKQWTAELDEEKQEFVVRYYYQSNRGAPAARNRGIEKATGDCLLFLDSDDRLIDAALTQLTSSIQSSDAQAVYGDCIVVDEQSGERTLDSKAPSRARNIVRILNNGPRTGSVLIDVQAVEGIRWREDLPCAQEWAFHLDLALDGVVFRYVDARVLEIRHHGDDVRINNLHNGEGTLNKVISEYILENEGKIRRAGEKEDKVCDFALVNLGGEAAASGNYKLAKRLMSRANRLRVLKQFLRGDRGLDEKKLWVPALFGARIAGWAYRINWYL